MMEVLRKEEADDIAHRDRCEVSEHNNKGAMEDLNHDIGRSEKALEKMDGKKTSLNSEIATLNDEINATQKSMAELLELRNKASADFVQALKDDQDAIALVDQAIIALTKFYKTNKIPLSLLSKQEPEYTVDIDKAPETSWTGANYGGRESESGGVISILNLIKEDLENEIKTARSDDATAQSEYLDQRGAMKNTLDTTKATKTAAEGELADVQSKMQKEEASKDQLNEDYGGQDE